MARIRAVATDLDGTLLRTDKLIHPDDIATAKLLRQKGVRLFIATGRHPALTRWYAEALGGVDLAITANGAQLCDFAGGRTVEEHFLTGPQAAQVKEFAAAQGAEYFVYTRDFPCYLRQDKRVQPDNHGFVMGKGPDFGDVMRIMDEVPDALDYPVVKVIFPDLDRARIPELQRRFGGCSLEIYDYDRIVAEIGPAGCSKGAALGTAARLYGFDLSEALVLGDNYNDLSMLRVAGYPVAPQNGYPEARQAAAYLCADNDHAPLTDAIRHFQPDLLEP